MTDTEDMFAEKPAKASNEDEPASTSKPARGGAFAALAARSAAVEANKASLLPSWPDESRAAPNEVLRCALFTARNRKHARQQFRQQEIMTYGGGRVVYTGEELRQDDLDVWLEIFNIQKSRGIKYGEDVPFTVAELRKQLGWTMRGAAATNRLFTILTRLKANAVNFHSNRLRESVSLSMLSRFKSAEDGIEHDGFGPTNAADTEWSVRIDPEVSVLFGEGSYITRIEIGQRRNLSGDLAKWLHGFYSSHRDPIPLLVETLIENSGLQVGDKHRATQLVKDALKELVATGFLEHWEIKNGLVSVKRVKRAQLT